MENISQHVDEVLKRHNYHCPEEMLEQLDNDAELNKPTSSNPSCLRTALQIILFQAAVWFFIYIFVLNARWK